MKSNVAVLVVILAGCSKHESPSPTPAAPSVVPSVAVSQASAAPAASQPVDEAVFTNAAARTITGRITDSTGKAAPAIVFVKSGLPPKKYPAPTSHVTLDQRDKAFVPHLLPVLLGTTVEFRNTDPVMHNVYSRSEKKSFDLGTYSSKDPAPTQTFDKLGRVDVFCAIHTNMHAIVYVLDHPYFGSTDARGVFTIPDVPAGSYDLAIWNDRTGEQVVKVTVTDGKPTVVKESIQ